MSNLKRWTQVGGGTFHKWTEAGDELVGIWRGQRDGEFGPLGMLDVEGQGRVSFPLHTALLSRVEGLKNGAEIRIVYTGKQKSKKGMEFKAFDVFQADAEDAPITGDGDDSVPF